VVGIIVLSVIVWLSVPPLLSKAMARRGFDGLSYLVIGVLFGPAAVVFAVMDVLFDVPEPPRILEAGRTGGGDVSVLVVGGDSTLSLSMITLGSFGSPLRRVGLAHVLPKGGARLDEVQAERDLRQAAMRVGHPELAVLFGRPDVAISEYAIARGYDVVVTQRPDRLLTDRLQRSGRTHWSVDRVPTLGRPVLLSVVLMDRSEELAR
jgi:hypothetical protein